MLPRFLTCPEPDRRVDGTAAITRRPHPNLPEHPAPMRFAKFSSSLALVLAAVAVALAALALSASLRLPWLRDWWDGLDRRRVALGAGRHRRRGPGHGRLRGRPAPRLGARRPHQLPSRRFVIGIFGGKNINNARGHAAHAQL